jgi:hypothetical protein
VEEDENIENGNGAPFRFHGHAKSNGLFFYNMIKIKKFIEVYGGPPTILVYLINLVKN